VNICYVAAEEVYGYENTNVVIAATVKVGHDTVKVIYWESAETPP
jgi:hypothetical protein